MNKNSPKITIESGKCGDAPQVFELMKKFYKFNFPAGIPKEWPVTEDMVKSGVGSFSDGGKYFELILAKDGELIIGEIIYHKIFNFYLGKVISLSQIFVDENYRNIGVGKKMVIELCRIADEEDAIIQWRTFDWNTHAQTFYLSLGAKVISETNYTNSDSKHIGLQMDRDAIKTLISGDNCSGSRSEYD